jgi:hypothetical protein
MIDRIIMSQPSTVPAILKNGINAAVVADNGFSTVKRTKVKKGTSSTSSQSQEENKQPMFGVRNS